MLGGSFDPIHRGHIHLAELARKSASLDRVVLIPALAPPHKTDRTLTDPAHRLNMIRLAIADRPWLSVDELDRIAGVPELEDDSGKDEDPFPEMALQPFEHYDYIMLVFRDHFDWSRALDLLSRESPEGAAGPDWVCPDCGSAVDGHFGRCWNCGAAP